MGLEINGNLDKIQISTIRKIAQEALKYDGNEKLINLTIGEPDLEMPKIIKDKMCEYLMNNKIGYSMLGGRLELRKEISNYYLDRYNLEIGEDEILVTVGSTEGLSTAIKGIILEGDEVIAPVPLYPGYEPLVTMVGGKLIKVDTSKTDYQLTVEILKKYITDRTKALILNYPSNPTGVVLDKKNRDEILKFAKENNLYIISDEVYSEIVFEKEYFSFLDSEYRDNVIIVNGFSKSHSMTGMRIGYLICSKFLRGELLKIHQYTVTSPCTLSQYGAIVALKECKDLSERKDLYRRRGEIVKNALSDMGFNVVNADGGIYIFASYRDLGIKMESLEFAMRFLHKYGVALVPGIAFGLEEHIRISLVQNEKILKESMERLKKYIDDLKKITTNI